MENILFGNYNNYYNRKLKRLTTWSEYNNAFNMSGFDLPHYNFNPGNCLETKIVVGTTAESMQFSTTSGPDYLIVYNDSKAILSRWFIIDTNRTRGGQYELTLKRDVLADFYHYVEQSPIYIEKGVIDDTESPLLRNNEGLSVNQIKTDEILLKDRTLCPWLVMYVKKGALGTGSPVGPNGDGQISINVGNNQGDIYETLATDINHWNMYQYTSANYNVLDLMSLKLLWKERNSGTDYYTYSFNATASNNKYTASLSSSHTNLVYTTGYNKTLFDNNFKANFSTLKTKLTNDLSLKNYNDISKYDGKIIKDSTGKYYEVNVYRYEYMPIPTAYLSNSNAPTTKSQMETYWNTMTSQTATANDWSFAFAGQLNSYRLTITEVPSLDVRIDFNNYTGQGAIDCPLYDVIAMPYGTVRSYGQGGLVDVTSSAERSMRVMSSLATALTSSWVLDLQLLPYCPMPELINTSVDGRMSIKYLNDTCLWSDDDGLYGDILYVPSKVNFTFDINSAINISDSSNVPASYKVKYVNDCTLLRLCSPNYNGLFDFNLAKNNMSVTRFNVDVTLRPQNPYIHVNPDFKGLYSTDWDDARGLICGGEFSLGIVDNAWNQYQIQNRNFQNIFDRQIQNLDVNNAITKQEAIFGAATGGITGAARGAAAGSVGGPYAAAAGAVLGGGVATLGGVLDVQNTMTRINENRSFAIDNYNLALGNVKALPDSVTRTSAIVKNNKLFPFIEIYECTEEEKEAYYLKLKYDGMTVGKIGTMINFTSTDNSKFFKGKLIRMEIFESADVIAEINNELSKGVYI